VGIREDFCGTAKNTKGMKNQGLMNFIPWTFLGPLTSN
jgi:hypothetical protein